MDKCYLDSGYIVCNAIGDAINKKENSTASCISKSDVENRVRFLRAHSLVSMLDFVVKKDDLRLYLSDDDCQKLDAIVKKAVFKQLKYDAMSQSISECLSKNAVKHIVLKGVEYKRFYPESFVRTSTDIDIYVDKSDLQKAKNALAEIGFLYHKAYDNREFSFKKEPRYYVELHTDLEGFGKAQKRELRALSDNANKVGGYRYALSDNDFYIYALFHLYKHFVLSGVGVRMFLDVYLIKKTADLDYDYIAPVLKKLGISGFEQAVTQVNSCLFEKNIANDDIKAVVQFIFGSGTFGTVCDNRYLRKLNSKATDTSKIKRLINDYGLGFYSMKRRYPVLEKAPFLYPFSFVHRFFYGIVHRRDVLRNDKELKQSISKQTVDKYERILNTMQIATDDK